MSNEALKIKPKYPETLTGTHCMGEGWTVCCPNKHIKYDRYNPTKQVLNLYYKGGIYRVFVCTTGCLSAIKKIAANPEMFKKIFIKGVKPNGDLILKHRDTGAVAQIAKKIDTYEYKPSSSGKTKKQKGGSHKSHSRRVKSRSRTMKRRR